MFRVISSCRPLDGSHERPGCDLTKQRYGQAGVPSIQRCVKEKSVRPFDLDIAPNAMLRCRHRAFILDVLLLS